MRTLKFHSDYIKFLMRDKDVHLYNLGTGLALESRISTAVEKLSDKDFLIEPPFLRKTSIGNLNIPQSWEDKLYLRHIERRLRFHYRINFEDRVSVVKHLIVNLQSDIPFRILRSDISSFFESVPLSKIVESINLDGFMRQGELRNLYRLLETSTSRKLGVMRGLPLASTLSEIYLQKFDSAIRRMPGVNYYKRYVDDFIILSSVLDKPLINTVREILPSGLELNPEKTYECEEALDGRPSTNKISYLGYDLTRKFHPHKGKRFSWGNSALKVSLSQKKMEKVQRRIVLSINEYKSCGSHRMLSKRLSLLTGNYKIKKDGHSDLIPVGIYYNHRHLDDDHASLNELDVFLKSQLLFLRRWIIAQGRDTSFIRPLLKKSFKHGFVDRMKHRFGIDELFELTKIWKHE